jgi:hypothetical protein
MPLAGSSTGSEYIAPLSSRERLILAEWERARVNRVTRVDVACRGEKPFFEGPESHAARLA